VPAAVRLVGLIGLIGLIGPLGLAGCPQEPPPAAPEPDWVALVNGEPISESAFRSQLDAIKQAGKGFFRSSEAARRIRRDLLERMIDEELLLQEAQRKRIVLEPRLIEATIDLIDQEYPDGGLAAQLEAEGRTLDAYREATRESLLVQRLLKQEVADRIAISRQDIEVFYNSHRDRFVRPEQVRVRQIVTPTREQAEQLRKEILRGGSFEALAEQHSLGPEAAQGGDLGWFPRGRMPPEIEQVAFNLWSGTKVSKVIESPYGFHLFQPVGKRPARELTLEQARQEIERSLTEERIKEAERLYVRRLREKASIERDLQRLARIH
jgi:parvulin-like peptidyl-prolyl isomerase